MIFKKIWNLLKGLCGSDTGDEDLEERKPFKQDMIKSNTIQFHNLKKDMKVEKLRKFTIVKDVNGNIIIKPYSFIYLGFPFVESDGEGEGEW
ncbi:MAG: hypothetical protein ACOX6N_04870 [Patescibacteria group bacterium]|jgi:hypothetical protein